MKLRELMVMAPVAVLLTGCDMEDLESWGSSEQFKEDFHLSYATKPGGTLTVENFNGSVEITSWEKDEVGVDGVKYCRSEELLRQLKVEGFQEGNAVRLRTVRPDGKRVNCGAKYILRVPKKVWLNGIVSSNGSIRVQDVDGDARLETSNGSIRLSQHVGKVSAKTSNASIEAMGLTGDFSGKTSNGGIRVDGLKGAFEGITSNSNIVARIEKLPGGRTIRADSSNGGIELYLPDYVDQSIEAQTSNSGITLRLPAGANAEIRASTSNSSIQNDFEIQGSGSQSKNRLEGTLGKGGALIRLNTSNGGIRLQKM
jgi:hypothetical protein